MKLELIHAVFFLGITIVTKGHLQSDLCLIDDTIYIPFLPKQDYLFEHL